MGLKMSHFSPPGLTFLLYKMQMGVTQNSVIVNVEELSSNQHKGFIFMTILLTVFPRK